MTDRYVSPRYNKYVYVAERSRKGSTRLLWSIVDGNDPPLPIHAGDVPYHIRRLAYRRLNPLKKATAREGAEV